MNFDPVEICAILSVAALDDVIDSKRAANRSKDQMALPLFATICHDLPLIYILRLPKKPSIRKHITPAYNLLEMEGYLTLMKEL